MKALDSIWEMSVQMKNPFFIVGAQRSGTSLLSSILNNHPSLAVPPESFFFNTFVPLKQYYGDLSLPENLNRFIDDVLSTPKMRGWAPKLTNQQVLSNLRAATFCSVFHSIMNSWAKGQKKSRWGEKTPHHVFYWKEISKCVPNAFQMRSKCKGYPHCEGWS